MKKIVIALLVVLYSCTSNANETTKIDTLSTNSQYIDLGLSSHTLWKNTNEKGFYSFNEAVKKYGNKLPTETQMQELKRECKWQWFTDSLSSGYKITGPNGKYIVLPAAGYGGIFDTITDINSAGFYWSRTSHAQLQSSAWGYRFYNRAIHIENNGKSAKESIRLVKIKK